MFEIKTKSAIRVASLVVGVASTVFSTVPLAAPPLTTDDASTLNPALADSRANAGVSIGRLNWISCRLATASPIPSWRSANGVS